MDTEKINVSSRREEGVASKIDMSLDDVIALSNEQGTYNRGRRRTQPNKGLPKQSFSSNRRGGDFKGQRSQPYIPLDMQREQVNVASQHPIQQRRFNRQNNNFFPQPSLYRKNKNNRAHRHIGRQMMFTNGGFDQVQSLPIEIDEEMAIISDGEIPTLPLARRRVLNHPFYNGQLQGSNRLRRSAAAEGRHVRIAGLDYSILTSDLEELFSSVGPIEKCWVDFDRTDRSLGTGGVIFESSEDAQLAVGRFNGRLIDGQPLQLDLIIRHFH